MGTDEKVAQLENEIKVLKNEVQAVLLDLRDRYLETENPFNAPEPKGSAQQVIVSRQSESTEAAQSELAPSSDESSDEGAEDADDEPGSRPAGMKGPAESEGGGRDRTPETTIAGKTPSGTHSAITELDLVAVAGLAQWAERSASRLGKARTETILDFSEIMGFLPGDLRRILTKLVNVETDANPESSYCRMYLDSLIEITTLLGKNNLTEQTMLSVLSGEAGPSTR